VSLTVPAVVSRTTISGLNRRKVWRLSRARKQDWPAIVALQSAEHRPGREDSRVSDYFVAKVGDELVGSVAGRYSGGTGYLYGLVVGKKWRRHGIGHALTAECLSHLETRSANRVFALAMFWNLWFFKKHGFVVAKRSEFPDLIDLSDTRLRADAARNSKGRISTSGHQICTRSCRTLGCRQELSRRVDDASLLLDRSCYDSPWWKQENFYARMRNWKRKCSGGFPFACSAGVLFG
jgi:N-acetylglutamate synthase-like GNAT family acetyltransferase